MTDAPNGAGALIGSLLASGVDTCFANPGTSEMHFVAALDAVKGMRPVLGLFEGVVTGAADGYGRMAGRPAVALLHLGPGLGNGVANLHNARKAHTPVVVVVGDHATYHKRLNAPLESDIDAIAGAVSGWVRRSWRPGDVGRDAADAVAAAFGPPGRVATLILPADVSWSAGGVIVGPQPQRPPAPVGDQAVDAAVSALRSGEPAALLIGGPVAASEEGLATAATIAEATGALLLSETFPRRLLRGVGRPRPARLAYLAEAALAQLEGRRHLLLAGAASPVSFFAYPGVAGDLVPAGCVVHNVGGAGDDAVGALLALVDALGLHGRHASASATSLRPAAGSSRAAGSSGAVAGSADAVTGAKSAPMRPSGPLTVDAVAATVGALLPEDAIVVDEAVTSAWAFGPALAGSPPHDLLTLTGGAIGYGLPAATGAACACPDRPVICLEADGSAMYTLTALWTQAREGLDVTTVIFNNRAYAILRMELARVEAGEPGPVATDLFDLSRPDIDFVALAAGFGVPGTRATTAEEFAVQFGRALAEPGPHLIEAMVT